MSSFYPSSCVLLLYVKTCTSLCVPVSPDDSHTCVLLNQGTFSWQGPDLDKERPSDDGADKGSLLLHSLNLHINKVPVSFDDKILSCFGIVIGFLIE